MGLVSVTCWERGGATSLTKIAVVFESSEVDVVSVGDVDCRRGGSYACWCSCG